MAVCPPSNGPLFIFKSIPVHERVQSKSREHEQSDARSASDGLTDVLSKRPEFPFERESDFIHHSLLTRKLFHINVIDSNGFSDKHANKSLAVLVA